MHLDCQDITTYCIGIAIITLIAAFFDFISINHNAYRDRVILSYQIITISIIILDIVCLIRLLINPSNMDGILC